MLDASEAAKLEDWSAEGQQRSTAGAFATEVVPQRTYEAPVSREPSLRATSAPYTLTRSISMREGGAPFFCISSRTSSSFSHLPTFMHALMCV